MADLSIIIPIYNTSIRDLRRCFTSITEPADGEWEVILIDDGSEQRVGQFCQAYAETHPMFRYFHKKNGGASSARNLGIEKATGRYITFLDADDILLSRAISTALLKEGHDLILFDMQLRQGRNQILWKALELPEGPVTRQDVLRRYLTCPNLNGPVAKLFRTKVLREAQLQFDENFITGEDWVFGSSFATHAREIHYCATPAYLYYRDSSNAQSRLIKAPDAMIDNWISLYQRKLRLIQAEFARGEDAAALRSASAAWVTETLFNCTAELYLNKLKTPDRRTRIRQTCAHAKTHLSGVSRKTKVKSWVLLHLPLAIYPIALLRKIYLKCK